MSKPVEGKNIQSDGPVPPIVWPANGITDEGVLVLQPADPAVIQGLHRRRKELTLLRGIQPKRHGRNRG